MKLGLEEAQCDSSQRLTLSTPDAEMIIDRVDVKNTDEVRLKRMGICEGRRIQLVQAGDPLIANVAGARVGISRLLAQHVWVTPCAVKTGESSGAKKENV